MKKREPTLFAIKMMELERIKTDFHRHMGRLNSVKIRYRDWFDRKIQSFLDAIKTVQITYPQLIPPNILTIKQFKSIYNFTKRLPTNGKIIGQAPAKMEEFLTLWTQLSDLKDQGDLLYERVCVFCDSITRLREPAIKLEIDRLHNHFIVAFSETYNFVHINNEKDNLFTYRISMSDGPFQGLIGFIPYLIQIGTRICFLCGKLHLEKE